MNHGTACGALVLTMAVGAGCSSSESDKRFGELPPNAVARLDLSGVRAEIGFRLLVDPALVRGQLPKGLRPRTLKFAPTRDSLLRAEFLPKHPGWENFITGQLAFLAYDTASLNGVPVTNSAPVVHALWWVQAEPAADSLDARAYGDMWVELGSFWDSAAAVRVRAIGIAGDVAPIEMRQTDSTTWVMHLVLPDADVRATCRLRGTATPAGYPLRCCWRALFS